MHVVSCQMLIPETKLVRWYQIVFIKEKKRQNCGILADFKIGSKNSIAWWIFHVDNICRIQQARQKHDLRNGGERTISNHTLNFGYGWANHHPVTEGTVPLHFWIEILEGIERCHATKAEPKQILCYQRPWHKVSSLKKRRSSSNHPTARRL